MRILKNILFVAIISISVGAVRVSAQEESKLNIFLRQELNSGQFSQIESSTINRKFSDLIVFLKEKKSKYRSDKAFLEFTFYYVHRKFLGKYEQYVTLAEMFSKDQKYDCVTGTTLYSLILDELGYQFEIRETDYHVYLLAFVDDKKFLLESTDPLYGFAHDPKEIKKRQDFVINDARIINEKLAMTGVSSNNSQVNVSVINNSVTLKELVGLHFYNQALRQFNDQNHGEAFRLATIAQGIYPSNRIKNAASFMFAVAFED